MRVIFRGKQSVAVEALLLIAGMLTSVGCSSKTEANSPGLSATQKTETGQEGNAGGNTRTTQAPLPPGATGTPADTFVKPGQ